MAKKGNISYFPTREGLAKKIARGDEAISKEIQKQAFEVQMLQVNKELNEERLDELANERDTLFLELKEVKAYKKEVEKYGNDPEELAYVNGEIAKLEQKIARACVKVKDKVEKTFFNERSEEIEEAQEKYDTKIRDLNDKQNETLDMYKKLYMPEKPKTTKVIDFTERRKKFDRVKEWSSRPDFAPKEEK